MPERVDSSARRLALKVPERCSGRNVAKIFESHGLHGHRPGDPRTLSEDNVLTIDAVLDFYGDKTAQWLSELTHQEEPWHRARERAGLRLGERGSEEITHEAMANYYSSLL